MTNNSIISGLIIVLYLLSGIDASSCFGQSSAFEVFEKSSYIIPKNIEPDVGYNHLLSDYIYECIVNDEISLDKDSLKLLFERSSYRDVALVLLNDAFLQNIEIGAGQLYFADYRYNYLYNCDNEAVLYDIADSLLAIGSLNGWFGIWENCDIERLKNYVEFRESNVADRNVCNLLYLITVVHNSANIKEYDYLKKQILNNVDACDNVNVSRVLDYINYLENSRVVTVYDFIQHDI